MQVELEYFKLVLLNCWPELAAFAPQAGLGFKSSRNFRGIRHDINVINCAVDDKKPL